MAKLTSNILSMPKEGFWFKESLKFRVWMDLWDRCQSLLSSVNSLIAKATVEVKGSVQVKMVTAMWDKGRRLEIII